MRLILIDNASGYVWGDSADFAGGRAVAPSEAARLLDESVGCYGRAYEEYGSNYPVPPNAIAYHVYRADSGGSEAVQDGQDQEIIEAVERECEKIAVVVCRDEQDA